MGLGYTFPDSGVGVAKETKKSASIASGEAGTDQVRTAVRFPMELPLRIKTANGVLEAVTVDISSNGILLTGATLPALDSRIEFTIAMPAAVMGADADVSIQCVGRVIRHQRRGTKQQAAVIIDEYLLRI